MPLTPEQVQAYERAAVACDNRRPQDNPIAHHAFWIAVREAENEDVPAPRYHEVMCNRAARILRECVAKNEELPR